MKEQLLDDNSVWVLADSITGNSNQAIELAKNISSNYEVKKISYNFLAKLPNMLLQIHPFHIKKNILNELASDPFPPKIIISAGRRTAALAIYLKKIFAKNDIKLIQIMKPDLAPEKFDLLILPQHDSFNHISPNIVRVIGAINNADANIQAHSSQFKEQYPTMKNFIAVLIGGSNKKYKLTISEIKDLVENLQKIAKKKSLKLLITFSRRTPDKVKKYIARKILPPNIIYSPEDGSQNSPYPAMLGLARYVIVTADSISMCSEAATSGTPVYIYTPKNFTLPKHNYFIQQLVDIGVARRLETNIANIENYKYTPLNELKRISDLIKAKFS